MEIETKGTPIVKGDSAKKFLDRIKNENTKIYKKRIKQALSSTKKNSSKV